MKRALAIDDIERRADGYGMPGVRVDGRDVRASTRGGGGGRARTRGDGPTLVVADSYRHEGHQSQRDPRKYQSKAEIEGSRTC